MTNSNKLITPLGNLSTPIPISNHIAESSQGEVSKIRFWREFAAGMKMFTLHLGRNNADLNDIFHRNLSLLHNTLKHEPLYQQHLQKLPSQASGHWNSIASSNEIHCGLVNIVSSSCLSINEINQKIPNYYQYNNRYNNQYENAQQTHGATNQGLLSILVISGKLKLDRIQQSHKNNSTKSSLILKPGNTHIQTSYASLDNPLSSHTASCQLLMLAIPHRTQH